MQINDQGTFYVEGEYKAGEIILTAGDWELVADVDGYKKYAFGYEPDDFPELDSSTFTGTGNLDGWSLWTGAINNNSVDIFDVTSSGVSNICASKNIGGFEVGNQYVVIFDRMPDSSTATAIRAGSQISPYTKLAGSYRLIFIATAPATTFYLQGGFANSRCKFDNISVKLAHPKAGDTIQLGNGHHKDFRYYPYKLSATDITELTR